MTYQIPTTSQPNGQCERSIFPATGVSKFPSHASPRISHAGNCPCITIPCLIGQRYPTRLPDPCIYRTVSPAQEPLAAQRTPYSTARARAGLHFDTASAWASHTIPGHARIRNQLRVRRNTDRAGSTLPSSSGVRGRKKPGKNLGRRCIKGDVLCEPQDWNLQKCYVGGCYVQG
jgi:hypothetical protein